MAKKKITGFDYLMKQTNGINEAEEHRILELSQIETELYRAFGVPEDIAKIAVLMNALTDEQRKVIIHSYCTSCGSKDPNCQCWNDE